MGWTNKLIRKATSSYLLFTEIMNINGSLNLGAQNLTAFLTFFRTSSHKNGQHVKQFLCRIKNDKNVLINPS